MSEFPEPFFALGDWVMVYIEDPAFAGYNGNIGRVMDTRWMNSKEAGEYGMAGWQYLVCLPGDRMMPLEGEHTKWLWCTESMLYKPHEAGMPFNRLMEELKATPPYLAGGDEFLPNERCGCGRPVRYIMGRVDAPILSCNRIRRCPSMHPGQKGDKHDQEER